MSPNGNKIVTGALHVPVRNRYFFGKKLDVRHFEMEQDYFNGKRWLLNRLILGFGVVCGLNVRWADEDKRDAVIVSPGLAIDQWGREVILVSDSKPVDVEPPDEGITGEHGHEQDYDDDDNGKSFVHICLEYHECETDPAPVLVNECDGGQRCMPDAIQERYKIIVKPGKAPEIGRRCRVPDLINNNSKKVNYDVMVNWITEGCPEPPESPCIALAEIKFDDHGHCGDLDITVRPIVYTNDLLYEIILALTEQQHSPRIGGRY